MNEEVQKIPYDKISYWGDDEHTLLEWLKTINNSDKWRILKKRQSRLDIYFGDEIVSYKWEECPILNKQIIAWLLELRIIDICCKIKKK